MPMMSILSYLPQFLMLEPHSSLAFHEASRVLSGLETAPVARTSTAQRLKREADGPCAA